MPAKPIKIAEHDMVPTDSVQSFWTVHAPAGTPREAPLNPIFWDHVHKNLRPMTEVRIIPKSGEWYGRFLVLLPGLGKTAVAELEFKNLQKIDLTVLESETMKVKFVSPPLRYCVIRKSDGERLKERCQTENDAVLWMQRYLQKQAA